MSFRFAHAALATASLAALAAITACGGGGGQAGLPGASSASSRGNATITIAIPSAAVGSSSSSRAPAFVSPNTQSVSIAVAAGSASPGPATTANLTSTSPGCTAATAAAPLTCTVTLNPPAGNDSFLVTLYQGLNATGNVLSTATVSAIVNANGNTVVPITLGGLVAAIAVSVTNGNNLIPGGYATSLPVVVAAKDASGATIVGPGNYTTPIALTNADTSGVTTLSTTTVTSPSTAVTLSYAPTNANGGVLDISGLPVGATTIGASAGGVASAAITAGTFQYIADRFDGFGHTRTLTGSGTAMTTTYNTAGVQTGSTTTSYPTITEAITTTLPTAANFNGASYSDTQQVYTYTQSGGNVETQTVDGYHAYTLNTTGATLYLYGKTDAGNYSGAGSSPITGSAFGTTTQTDTWSVTNPWESDVLPHTSAGASWSNNFLAWTDVYSGTETATFTTNSDGSYSFTETAPNPITQIASTTGAATNNFVTNYNLIAGHIGTITVSPPTAGGIPVAGQQTTPPAALTNFVGLNWYPGGAPTSPLYVETYSLSLGSIPPACAVPSTLGTQAYANVWTENELRIATLDYVTRLRTDYFIPGTGNVCESFSETNTSHHFSTGNLDVVTVISYTVGLNNSTTGLSVARSTHS